MMLNTPTKLLNALVPCTWLTKLSRKQKLLVLLNYTFCVCKTNLVTLTRDISVLFSSI